MGWEVKTLRVMWNVMPGTHIDSVAKQAAEAGCDAFIHNDRIYTPPYPSLPVGRLRESALRHPEDEELRERE